ncbi:hypothetical protein FIU85_13115 [Roseovarius sp. THAF8]|uniref:DUF2306 domain-containing protein n=1 Tax=Roseovarius sp. THAF8 TaxID=2587846 RepID=UPI001267E5A0|nr:DUF2306 domain-containing protein [Roseovarius sp. THAF8]QFT98251.1 hypothetical protein FIU85_13115 [Roseovarius sp. THAF8]
MTLDPLLSASPMIVAHTLAALAALALGALQLILPKGTGLHRGLGSVWVILMLVVAASSFWIHTMQVIGPFSPIHVLSIIVLISAPLGLYYAQTGQVTAHRRTMQQLFAIALIGAGLFTLWPGRIMHQVVFGP